MKNWLIYRGSNFLAGYCGTYEQAMEWAYEQFGIGCCAVRE